MQLAERMGEMGIPLGNGKVGPALILVAAGLHPAGAQAARKPQPQGVALGQAACPSPRQMRLEAFREVQEEIRGLKRASRQARLEQKRARLEEALGRARDRIQVLCLNRLYPEAGRPDQDSSLDAKRRILGPVFLGLLAGELLMTGEAAAAGAEEVVIPPPPGSTQAGGQEATGTAGAGAVPADLHVALTDILMEQLASEEIDQTSPMVRRALAAQRTLLQNAMRSAIDRPAPAPRIPGVQLLQGAFRSALQDTSLDFLPMVLPPEFGPLPSRRRAVSGTGPAAEPVSERVRQAQARLDAAKKEVVAAIREAKSVGADIVISATSLLAYGGFAAVAYGLDIGASISGIFTASPVTPAAAVTGALYAAGNQWFLIAYASDAVAGAVAIQKFREPYIDALLRVADAEDAWVVAYEAYTAALRQPGLPAPPDASASAGTGTETAGAPPGTAPSAETGMDIPARPSIGEADDSPETAAAPSPGAEPLGQTSGAARGTAPFWG